MLKYDCKYFKGDRPCSFNKINGTVCSNCDNYFPIQKKILIIKLDAIGDVLRTTSILKPLKNKYPDFFITWLTKSNAKDLFRGNLFVDEVLTIDSEDIFRLLSEKFDIVINLDNSKTSSSIASLINGNEKIGFLLDEKGFVLPTNSEADYWLHLSAFDSLKRENNKTYQEVMYSILNLEKPVQPPLLFLDESDLKFAQSFSSKVNLSLNKTIIGLNIGIGPKWPSKGWPLLKWEELIKNLTDNNFELLLLVGPEEKTANDYLLKKYPFIKSSGCNNSLKEFASIMNLCNVIVTSDSLALHIATALNKKVIVLFGPTSDNEIELYTNGIKLKSEDGCKCFYNKYCSEDISCMEKISSEKVYDSIKNILQS